MRFSEVIGHGRLKTLLAGMAGEGRVSHALLFSGRSGSGTLPLAVAYAQYLNCPDRSGGDSCGVCTSCVKIGSLAHPDLHFAYPVNSASKGGSSKKQGGDFFLPQWRELWKQTGGCFDEPMWYDAIGIENQQGIISRADADEILRKLSLKAFEARYKVVVIWLPERMRPEAANALLKILEEPWERTVFILASENPDLLLPTITSRTQRIDVPGIDEDDLRRALEAEGIAPGVAADAARLSTGDLAEARRTAGGEDAAEGVFFEMFSSLMRLSYNDKHMELLEWGDAAAALGREEQKRLLRYCVRMLRENYMLCMGMGDITYLRGPEAGFSEKFSPYVNNGNIEPLCALMEEAIAQVHQNGNPRMIFPHLALAVSKLITRLQ